MPLMSHECLTETETAEKRQRPTRNHSGQWCPLQETKHRTKEKIG